MPNVWSFWTGQLLGIQRYKKDTPLRCHYSSLWFSHVCLGHFERGPEPPPGGRRVFAGTSNVGLPEYLLLEHEYDSGRDTWGLCGARFDLDFFRRGVCKGKNLNTAPFFRFSPVKTYHTVHMWTASEYVPALPTLDSPSLPSPFRPTEGASEEPRTTSHLINTFVLLSAPSRRCSVGTTFTRQKNPPILFASKLHTNCTKEYVTSKLFPAKLGDFPQE